MKAIDKSDLFFEKLKARLIALGFQEKIAITVASFIRPVKLEGSTIIADCKNGFYRDTIISAKMSEINAIAKECWGPDVEFFLRSEPDPQHSSPVKRKAKTSTKKEKEVGSIFDFTKIPTGASTTLDESALTSASYSEERPSTDEAKEESTTVLHASKNINKMSKPIAIVPQNVSEDSEYKENTSFARSLMPELNFSTFVRGNSNLVAHSACEAVAKNPGNLTNPVFIYGATGLGKTHLLHSVGNEILKNHPDWTIVYVTSGDFMNELIASIRFSKQESFRKKYRSCDVLLLDDIQFLENKDSTQLEFFHTFNELYQNKKQIVITSDKYPKDIPNIEERLKSRFLQGLIADVEPPSFEDRVSIIEAKRKSLGLKLTRDVTLHIATHVKANVREIQGVLNNLVMTQSMNGQPPTVESVNVLLKRIVRAPNSAVDVNMIQRAVAQHFGIKLAELLSQNRSQRLVWPRHIAMFLAKELIDAAVTEIAEAFGKKDHTTVMHAVSKVRENMEGDTSTRAMVNEIKRKLDQFLF